MNPFALSGLLAGSASLAFGILVFVRSEDNRIGRVWLAFSLSVAIWGFGGMGIAVSGVPEKAILAWRVSFAAGVIWIPILFHHFVLIFCFPENKNPIKWVF